jgi:hypothetical protein
MSDRYYRWTEHGVTNAIFIPDNWPADEEGDFLGYGSTRLVSNDPQCDCLWFPPDMLTEEITEAEARAIHPALFEHLDRINRGEV